MTEQLNRLSNAVRGKGKKGAQVVDADAILCYIVTSDGQRHPVRTNVKGKIVEINPKLVERPELIRDDPRGEGYVAILLPKLPDGILEMKEMLATREDGAGPAASAPDAP